MIDFNKPPQYSDPLFNHDDAAYYGPKAQLPPGMDSLANSGFMSVVAPENFGIQEAPVPVIKVIDGRDIYRINLRRVNMVITGAGRVGIYVEGRQFLFDEESDAAKSFIAAYDK